MAKGDQQVQNQLQNQSQNSVQNQNQDTSQNATTNQTQTQNQNTNQASNQVATNAGQTATNQVVAQTSQTNPWGAAGPLLQSLIDQYSGLSTGVTPGQGNAAQSLTNAAGALPNFGGASTGALANLFGSSTTPQVGMLSDALKGLQGNIGGTASGAELDPYSTPGFSDAIKTMTQDITDRVKGVYNASGRDLSGSGSGYQALSRGLTQGIAPTIAAQFNQNKANQLGAANSLYGAGTGTAGAITGQQQVPLSNAVQAMGLIPNVTSAYMAPATAQLGAANIAQGLPFQNLMQLLQPALALGGAGSSTSGTGTTMGTGSTFGTGTTAGTTAGAGTSTGTTAGTSAMTGTGATSGTSSGTGTGDMSGTTTQKPSLISNLLGAGLGAAGLASAFPGVGSALAGGLSSAGGAAAGGIGSMLSSILPFLAMSDKRAKTDIAPVGMLNDGQKIHRFRYKGDPVMRIGLLAQDVAKHVPSAVHKTPSGMLAVDHAKATDRAAAMEKGKAA